MFPKLQHINDVLPFIQNKDSFVHLVKDNYQVIDYVCSFGDTFPYEDEDPNASMYLECRGLIFDLEGNLISRPLHKFFNFGERKDQKHINLEGCEVYEKLDGSMVRPIYINNTWRLATRKGVTDVSNQAEAFLIVSGLQVPYVEFFEQCKKDNITPIFEWCSLENRIVNYYPVSRLILTNLRNITTGEYISLDYCKIDLIDKVSSLNILKDLHNNHLYNFVDTVHKLEEENFEGVVVSLPSGYKVKIKTELYCQLHKVKDYFTSEKDIVQLILDEKLDDILPLLSVEDKEKLEKFYFSFHENLAYLARKICIKFFEQEYTNKKDYALNFVLKQPKQEHKIYFELFKLEEVNIPLVIYLLKTFIKTNSKESLKDSKWIYGDLEW